MIPDTDEEIRLLHRHMEKRQIRRTE
jgi:hypothetical protein